MRCKHELEYSVTTDQFKYEDRFILITEPFTLKATCTVCQKEVKKRNLFVIFGVLGDFEIQIPEVVKEKKNQPIKWPYMGE